MTPIVSVIIPTYNRKSLTLRAIASVAAQTFGHYELIVVDDDSSDGTGRAVLSAAPSVRLIRHESNRGTAAARNTGVAAALGRWVAFLDSDDHWEPNKLAVQVEILAHLCSPYLACCTGYYFHRRGEVSQRLPTRSSHQFASEILWGCSISPGTTLVVERGCFKTVGPFDENLRRLEDWDWLLRYAQHGDMACAPAPLAHVYFEDPGVSAGGGLRLQNTLEAIDQIERKHAAVIRSKGVADYRKFRSSLYVERAAVMYHQKKGWRAISFLAMAMFLFPFRNAAFFQSLLRDLKLRCQSSTSNGTQSGTPA